MTPDDIKREREQLQRDIEARGEEIARQQRLAAAHREADAIEQRRYDRTPRTAAPVSTDRVGLSSAETEAAAGHGFTPREVALLTAAMGAFGEVMKEERQKAHDDLRRMEEQLRHALEHKADIKKLDRIVSEFRSELLTERLSSEREMRAMEQRYYRDRDRGRETASGEAERSRMIEIN